MGDGHEPYERTADINRGLDDVGPDDGGEASFKRIDEGQCGDDRDRGELTGAQCNGDDDRDRVDTHAFGGGTREQEQSGGDRAEGASKAAFDELIGGVEISAEVVGQEQKADDNAADDVSEDDL